MYFGGGVNTTNSIESLPTNFWLQHHSGKYIYDFLLKTCEVNMHANAALHTTQISNSTPS